MNRLILGTVQFGLDYGINNSKGIPPDFQLNEILDYAYNKGISSLDTAEAYGNSQQRIGFYHQNSTNSFNVITKFSSSAGNLSKNITQRVNDNLKILNVEKLYSYMFHSFKDYKKYYEDFEKDLKKLQNVEKIKKIGVSVYTNDEAFEVLKNSHIQLMQIPFNLLDNINQRKEVIEIAKSNGVEVHVRSVFLQGLFFKTINEIKGNITTLIPYLQTLKVLVDNSNDLTMQDMALNYVYKQKKIDNILIGIDTIEQLKNNIKSLQKQVSNSIFEQIDNIHVKEKELLNPSLWKI